MNGLPETIPRRHLLLVCLAVLVALAGCAGGGGDGTATETPINTTTPTGPDNGTTLPQEASIDNYTAGEGLDSELTPPSELAVDGETVLSDTLAAIEGVDSYRLTGNSTIRSQTNNVDQRQEIRRVTEVDRLRPALTVNSTVTARGQTRSQQDYYVDGMFYRHSPLLVQQCNSEWAKQNVSENFTSILQDSDRLTLYNNLLENGTASLEGAQTVDGERTYRLRVETDGEAAASVLGIQNTNSSEAAMITTFWVDANSSTIVRAEGQVEIVTTAQGQTAVVSGSFVEHVEYGGIEVSLPDSAASAVSFSNCGQ